MQARPPSEPEVEYECPTPPSWQAGKRSRHPRRGSVYRGDAGMWSWVAHRITGVLTFFFLFAHVLDTALVRVSPEAYNEVIETYKNPVRQPDGGRPGRARCCTTR